jgi:hypothetical protein
MHMRSLAVSGLLLVASGTLSPSGLLESDEPLRFTPKGEMMFPLHYREWVWLSSGLGMSYTPAAGESENPLFDNVFVSPGAYQAFLAGGKWPNGSVFMLEVRASQHRGSINQAGRYQGDLRDVEAHVKKPDGTWAFYSFGSGHNPARIIPHDANCYSCHQQHGALDTTFVQFYPTLLPVARQKGTLNGHELIDNNR